MFFLIRSRIEGRGLEAHEAPSTGRGCRLPGEEAQRGQQQQVDGAASGVTREEEGEPGGEEQQRGGGAQQGREAREHRRVKLPQAVTGKRSGGPALRYPGPDD